MRKLKTLLVLIIFLLLFLLPNSSLAARNDFLHSPYQGSKINNHTPNVSFSFGSHRPVASTIKIRINGENVTDLCVITPSFISFRPREPLKVGKNFVQIEFYTTKGKKVDFSWSFIVISTDIIKSVTYEGISPLMIRETLTVTLKGKPACKAVFNIGSFIKDQPMMEIKPGVYRGSYTVKDQDHALNQPITGNLRDKNGTVCMMSAKGNISIFAQLFRLKIISPRNGDKVGKSFILKGRTKPKCVIHLSSRLGYTNTNFISAKGPDTGGLTAVSDDQGNFEKKFGFPLFMRGMQCSISAYARDANKFKSNVEEITVYYKNENDRKP